jgi:Mg-chelatase subunit ChlD
MKTKLIAIALFGLTAAAVAYYPAIEGPTSGTGPDPTDQNPAAQIPATSPASNQRPVVDVVFALDTTGSMGGLIQAAKEKIWSIASTMAAARPTPQIRMGLVAYRDRGDDYVTRVVDLTADLDSVYAALMQLQAGGGGDGPEAVNQALDEAVNRVSWSQEDNAYKVVFLVGDAPPHMDYQDDVKYPVTLAAAKARGIRVNTVQCGDLRDTAREWQQIAQFGDGRTFQVDQAGGAVAIATPFDARLAKLAEELDGARLYFGSAAERKAQADRADEAVRAKAAASPAALARRATFNASEAGKDNLLGKQELVDAVTSGRVDLKTVAPEALPAPMQAMSPEERQELVTQTAAKRDAIKSQIQDLADERARYLKERVEAEGGAAASLDHKVFEAVREQAKAAGLSYGAEAPAY